MLKETIAFVILSIYASTCSAVCITQPLTDGGIKDVDINDPGVIAAAYNAHSLTWGGSTGYENLKYIIKGAKSQIVAGIKYYITVDYSETILCDYEIIYQSWINEYTLVAPMCSYMGKFNKVSTTVSPTTVRI